MITKSFNVLYAAFIRILIKFGIDAQNESVISLIKADFYRCTGSEDINEIFSYLNTDTGFKFILFLRLSSIKPQSFFKKRIHAFSYYFHKRYFYKFGYQIPINTKIGKGFQLLHFGNVIFNVNVEIGDNCTVFPGVVIGQDKMGNTPKIGNKVWIGANVIIVGKVSIGDNVLIAPGSYVNFDIPDNCLVIGNPAKYILKTEKIIDGYINNSI